MEELEWKDSLLRILEKDSRYDAHVFGLLCSGPHACTFNIHADKVLVRIAFG